MARTEGQASYVWSFEWERNDVNGIVLKRAVFEKSEKNMQNRNNGRESNLRLLL